MENNEDRLEVSAPITEGDQAAETENEENEEISDNLTEIKEILLQNQEVQTNNNSVVEVPLDNPTEEEFIKFNNSFCTSIICLVLVCGIIGGLILGKAFQGIFK